MCIVGFGDMCIVGISDKWLWPFIYFCSKTGKGPLLLLLWPDQKGTRAGSSVPQLYRDWEPLKKVTDLSRITRDQGCAASQLRNEVESFLIPWTQRFNGHRDKEMHSIQRRILLALLVTGMQSSSSCGDAGRGQVRLSHSIWASGIPRQTFPSGPWY